MLRTTALGTLAMLIASQGFAQEAASYTDYAAAQIIRDRYGDPTESWSADLTDAALIGGLTADGGAFVGSVYRSYGQSIYTGFIWTPTGGIQPAGNAEINRPLTGNQYYTASDVSADGSVIVGKAANGVSDTAFSRRAYRWTADAGFENLDDENFASEATSVSGDGSVIVGYIGDTGGQPFRWTEETGLVGLGWLEGGNAEANNRATGVSWDGSVVVGEAKPGGKPFQAFRWTEASGMIALPTLDAQDPALNTAAANDVSWDGNVIVGLSQKGQTDRAVRWVDGQISELGDFAGSTDRESEALGISGNGMTIVGKAMKENSTYYGFRWTEATGMQQVEEWLEASGATVQKDQFGYYTMIETAEATNANGSVVVGLTRDNKVYIARGNGTGSASYPGAENGGGSNEGGDGGSGEGGDQGGEGEGETGGNSGGGNTGGTGNTGGGNPGGNAGMALVEELSASLSTSGVANTTLVNGLGVIVNGAGSRPLDRRVGERKFTAWIGGDLGRDAHGSRDGALGLGEIGIGYNFGALQFNGVAGFTRLTQNTLLGGSTDVDAAYLKLEAMGQITGDDRGGLWGVFTATGLVGDADIARNYVVDDGAIDTSLGGTDVGGYGVRGRLQYENLFPYLSPYGELSYSRACLDGYSETGGAFPASFGKLCSDSTELRYGIDAKMPLNDTFRLIGTLEGVHRFEGTGSNVTGQIIGLQTFDLGAEEYKQDWLRAGAGFELDVAGSTLSVMGNLTTQGQSSNAWIAANWRMSF